MVSAGLLSATAKTCASKARPEIVKSDATNFAVRAEGLFNNLSIFNATRASTDRAVKAEQQSSPRRMRKKPGTGNMSMPSTKVVR